MIETGIFHLISTASAVTAIVGARVYPLRLPTGGSYPAVTYRVISRIETQNLTSPGMQRLRLEVNAFAKDYGSAALLRDALHQTLDRYAGTLSEGTFLQATLPLQQIDFYDDSAEVYRCMSEYALLF